MNQILLAPVSGRPPRTAAAAVHVDPENGIGWWPTSEILPQAYAGARRAWRSDSVALLRAAARHPGSRSEPAEVRMVMRERLLTLVEWIDRRLATPIAVSDRCGVREVAVFDTHLYRIDSHLRSISVGRLEGGEFVPASYRVELLRPLCTSFWLHTTATALGLFEGVGQLDLFSDQDDGDRRNRWLADAAYAVLKPNPRFRLLRRTLHRAFALDPELVRIALSARRPWWHGLTNERYSRIWRQEEGLRRIARVCPRVLPLAAVAVIDHGLLLERQPLAALKALLIDDHGLGKGAWRQVVRHGARMLRVAWETCDDDCTRVSAAAAYLDMLQAAHAWQPPPPAVARAYLRQYGDEINFDAWRPGEPAAVLSIAFREADRRRRSPQLTQFIDEFLLVCRWAAAVQPVLDRAQRKAGWPRLVRSARDWERAQLLLARSEGVRWPCPVVAFRHGGYVASALGDPEALVEEGFAMRHCVAQYVDDCLAGKQRFFSIRHAETGRRVATLSLRLFPEGDMWVAAEVKKFANEPAGPELWPLVDTLVDQHNAPLGELQRHASAGTFDDAVYQAARVHLDVLSTRFAAEPVEAFFGLLVQGFGSGVTPFAHCYAQERRLQERLPAHRILLQEIAS